jgi:hypothetical protein
LAILNNDEGMNNSSALRKGSARGRSIVPGTGDPITETGSSAGGTTATESLRSATADTSGWITVFELAVFPSWLLEAPRASDTEATGSA